MMRNLTFLLALLLCAVTVSAQSTPPSSYNATITRVQYLEPALTGPLDLTIAGRGIGYSFQEPLLSTAVFTRVTDANFDPCNVGHNYSAPDTAEVRAWNVTSSMFYILDLNNGVLWPLNRNLSKAGSTSLPCGGISTSGLMTGGSALPSWSGKSADIWWGTLGFKLRKFDFSTVTSSSTTIPFTEPLDYDAVYNAITGGHLVVNVDFMCSLGVSGVDAANDFVATAMVGSQDSWKWAVWWDSATGRYKVLDTFTNPMRIWDSASPGWVSTATAGNIQLHNVKIAQDGVTIRMTQCNPACGHIALWNTSTGVLTGLPPATDFGHTAAGYGVLFNQYANGSDATQWLKRAFTSVSVTTGLVNPLLSDPSSVPQYVALNPDFDEHESTHNQRSGQAFPLFSSTSRTADVDLSHPWRPYDNEMVAIGTGDTRIVYRIAHHMSRNTSGGPRAAGYYDNAFGQVSSDGRDFIVGTNWGMTLTWPTGRNPNTDIACAPCYRIDAFKVALPVGGGGAVLRGKTTLNGKIRTAP